ncbi:MAG TPA: 4-hydroxy-tetrahydrodipicolinate synthase [Chitinispirillaceae bacterium]|nr:4-hydroxy-tetrahydrodipicolinate synthase [Chitinispirillaceae bacterium]
MEFKGCYVAIVTPFSSDGTVNEQALRDHVEFLINGGVAGIVPCGTTGESATLSWEEHNRIVDIVIDQAAKRVQIIAGAGSNNTRESINAAQHAQQMGADAILCITPYYNKPTQEGLFQHYKTINDSISIPIVVYNVPGRTGVNLLPETVQRLSELKNVLAIKEASGNVGQISEIHRLCGKKVTILSGDDALTLPILSVGGKGVISVVANIVPGKMVALINNYLNGNCAEALKLHEELYPLSQSMFIETNPTPVKTAMNLMGLQAGPVRLPLVGLSERNKDSLVAVLRSCNIKIQG